MFEQASKLKLRYKVANGTISTEDLWDLSLESLDKIARSLHRELREEEEVSFITSAVQQAITNLNELRFGIVKHIIEVKLAAREAKKVKEQAAAKKETIKRILAAKQDETLQNMSIEDLQKELQSLE
ncbi:MAG: hypothetical protein WC967_13565 [Balneolaceae bacterium]